MVKIIVGLGNPGDKYKNTRHNIGFMVTEALASKYGIDGKHNSKFNALFGKGVIEGQEVIIVQPLTYMNLSGQSVSKVLSWYKSELSELIVIYDDISIDLGKIRFRPSGSAGGHNGIKSIISCCGGDNFDRLKVGIGPNPGEHLWASYVLEKFSEGETEVLKKVIPLCVESLEYYLKTGINSAQNEYNGIDARKNL